MQDSFFLGVASVTFRRLSVDEVIQISVDAGLECIEWGGDVHVPHGNIPIAKEVAAKTADAGLFVSSYGSYYRVGESEATNIPYQGVLDSAIALGAPVIRVWAGSKRSAETTLEYRRMVEQDARRISEMTCSAGLEVSYEFHDRSLTDTCQSTLDLLSAVPGTTTYWQVEPKQDVQENVKCLQRLLPHLRNIHVYHCEMNPGCKKLSLREGKENWGIYLKKLSALSRKPNLLMEFVRSSLPEALKEDVEVLREIIQN